MSDSLPKQKKLISISETAKVLSVSIDTVRRWDKSGVLHSERPDGKNRYFSLGELKTFKLTQPLPISEVAQKLRISPTTLRRLEARGIFIPQRNNAGERVYDKNLLEKFLKSNYFLRKKQVREEFPENITPEKEAEPLESKEAEIPHLQLIHGSKRRINEFITGSSVLFMLLIALSLRNIWISEFNITKALAATTSEVLSENTYVEPEITPKPEATSEPDITTSEPEITLEPEIEATAAAKPLIIVMVKTEGGSSVNIRQEPTTTSKQIHQAKNGDIFEFVSEDSDWFKVKLASDSAGFISTKYAERID